MVRGWCYGWQGLTTSGRLLFGLEILKTNLTACDQPVLVVEDGHQPKLLAPSAMHRF